MIPAHFRQKFFCVISLMLLVIYLVSGCNDLTDQEYNSQSLRVEKQLNHKYGKEFTVTDIKITQANLGEPKLYKVTAYPNDDPSLFFAYTSHLDGTKSTDTYLEQYWSKCAKQELLPQINRQYEHTDCEVSIRFYSFRSDNQLLGYTPSWEEAKRTYADKLTYRLVTVVYGDNIKTLDKAARILENVKTVRELGFRSYALEYDYFESSVRETAQEIISERGVHGFLALRHSNKGQWVDDAMLGQCIIEETTFPKIATVADVTDKLAAFPRP